MPVKWTAENDQRLLMLIIEVCKVSPDVKQIAERWTPKDGEDRPTPRAIGERIHKIRNQIKANGGEMHIINKNGGGNGGPKAEGKTGTGSNKTKGNAKAQKASAQNLPRDHPANVLATHVTKKDESGDEAEQMPTPPTSTKRKRSLAPDTALEDDSEPVRKIIKHEPLDFDGALDVGGYTLLSNSIANEA